jgi:hypothetical protein
MDGSTREIPFSAVAHSRAWLLAVIMSKQSTIGIREHVRILTLVSSASFLQVNFQAPS